MIAGQAAKHLRGAGCGVVHLLSAVARTGNAKAKTNIKSSLVDS